MGHSNVTRIANKFKNTLRNITSYYCNRNFKQEAIMKGWNRIAWGVAGATLLFLALADTHSGVITKHVSSISLLGMQKQQIEKLDVVAQRTWFDRC
jgi:hypothetical protein